jgi:parvulin-like peptidyl-prolyl isomerase
VRSRFGWHLLRVTERVGARTPSFEEQQAALLALWSQRAREGARQELLRRLAAEYRTTLDRGASPQIRERVAQAAATLAK